ncbi:MAG: STAS-like domain-containing protein [Phycisphaerales bacterium]
MNSVQINAKDLIDPAGSVVGSATRIGNEAARHLRTGAPVVISLHGVRGVSSSFFNVIFSLVAEVLRNDFNDQQFRVDTETATQRLVYMQSRDAFLRSRPSDA